MSGITKYRFFAYGLEKSMSIGHAFFGCITYDNPISKVCSDTKQIPVFNSDLIRLYGMPLYRKRCHSKDKYVLIGPNRA